MTDEQFKVVQKQLLGEDLTPDEENFKIPQTQMDKVLLAQKMAQADRTILQIMENFAKSIVNSEISPEDFESCKDFFKKYKDECLMQLSNYKEITEKIIAPLQNMEENDGSWEGLKEESLQFNDDGYNAEKGN